MDSNKAAAVEIIGKLQEEGHIAYLAGGCVRDMLRGEIPKDYDIATSALPQQITTIFSKTREVGVHFGVVIVIKDNQAFDVATFRNDGSYKDGRHPEDVTFSTPEEDTARRDFTINGIFFDPISQKHIDFVDGRSDIEKKVVRAIGDPDLRFQEDHLRLLRAVRFAARFNYEIEEKTWKSIKLNASGISKISKERVRDELTKILLNENRVLGFDLLVDSGLMEHIIPEILQLKGCEQPPQFHPEGDVFVHTRLMLSLLNDNPSIELVLSVLLHDLSLIHI